MNQAIKFLPDEKVILKLRKHWMILVRDTIGIFLLILLPLILIAVLQIAAPQLSAMLGFTTYTAYAITLWLLLIWMALCVIWTDYYLDLWIVTDKRIISVDQISLFNRKVTSLGLEKIQEIIVKEENMLQAFFHYGTLDIETASPTEHDAMMEGIPEPENVRRMILEQTKKSPDLM